MQPRQVFRSYKEGPPWGAELHYCPRCGERFAPRPRARRAPLHCPVCGFTLYGNPLPGVVVLIERGGKVLLCKRAESSFQPGRWCLPGGFIEHDEDFITAGKREAREETGLSISIQGIISVVSNYLSPKLHTLVVVLLGRVEGGRARAGDDAAAVEWVDPAEGLPEMAFDADTHIITRWFDAPFSGAPVDPRFSRAARGRRQK